MITLNTNESKSIEFDISVQGVEVENLKGAMRIVLEDIEYGFPIQVSDSSIYVTIPALGDLIKGKLIDENIEAKLEIIADDTYIVPWEDTIKIESPVVVEAKVKDIKEIKKLNIDVKKVVEKKVVEKKKVVEVKKPKTRFGKMLGS